jgi:hypothetical protein
MSRLVAFCAVALLAAGCGGSDPETTFEERGLDLPPAASTWPPNPDLSDHPSCWARPHKGPMLQAAPVRLPARRTGATPQAIANRVLARFGDRRFIRGIRIGPPPPHSQIRGFLGAARPPADAVWAYVDAPRIARPPIPREVARYGRAFRLAQWELPLVGGALRDEFCDAGGAPLLGWSVGGAVHGFSDGLHPFLQDFPNPSVPTFRRAVAEVGRRHGFRVVSLRMLRPRQWAPLMVVETQRDRADFVKDVPSIMFLLNPGHSKAKTFEGFFLEARDEAGPFVSVHSGHRGSVWGGQWSWDPCTFPYPHGGGGRRGVECERR